MQRTIYRDSRFENINLWRNPENPDDVRVYIDFRSAAGKWVRLELPYEEAGNFQHSLRNTLIGACFGPGNGNTAQNGASKPQNRSEVAPAPQNAAQSQLAAPARSPVTRGGNPIVITNAPVTGKPADAVWTDGYCSVCNERQFDSPSGLCCINGHGGAEPMKKITRLRMPKPSKVEEFLDSASEKNVTESRARAVSRGRRKAAVMLGLDK